MKALHIVKKPIVTEKALKMGEKMTYTFYVDKKATKVDIKQAMKELYGHPVETVRIMNTPSKSRSYGRKSIIKKPQLRKALVTFRGKKKVDVTKVSKEKSKK